MNRSNGRCALGINCQFPHHQLTVEHKCSLCKQIVHVMCAEWDSNTESHYCKVPCQKLPPLPPLEGPAIMIARPSIIENTMPVPIGVETNPPVASISRPTQPPSVNICGPCVNTPDGASPTEVIRTPPAASAVAVKRKRVTSSSCNKCGLSNHQRKSSKLCKFYTGNNPSSSSSSSSQKGNTNNTNDNNNNNNATTTGVTSSTTQESNNANDDNVNNNNRNNQTNDADISRPKYIHVKDDENEEVQYKPVADIEKLKKKPTIFKVMNKTNTEKGRLREVVPCASALTDKYWDDNMLQQIVNHSNAYISERRRRNPLLDCWKRKKESNDFKLSDTCQFLAMLYYMGVVQLPSKDDYWSTHPLMPSHELCNELNMTRNRFRFMWRHFHLNFPHDDDFDEETDGNDDDDDDHMEIVMERVQRDQEEINISMTSDDELGINESANNAKANVWFDKLRPLVDHFRTVSEDLIFTLGTLLAVDEMMIRFVGKSAETHRIKNKPIKEGYKFFVLATIIGFIVNFTPDGRKAAKEDNLEYDQSRKFGKTEAMLNYVLEIIPRLREKQRNRAQKRERSTRSSTDTDKFDDDEINEKFVITMDNYFTFPKVIKALRDLDIGVLGTSRFRKTWPPRRLKNVNKEKANFNEFYWTIDEFGTLIARWMDNGMVFVVSTVHQVGKMIKRLRKRPRKTEDNRRHVDKVWGDKGCVHVYIPTLIDDYNHWMGGVDMADQRISYYHPNLRCQRTWIPMFMQIISMVRTNSYLVYSEHCKKNKKKGITHKEFTYEIITHLMTKARQYHLHESGIPQILSPHQSSPCSDLTRATSAANTPSARTSRSSLSRFKTPPNKHTIFSHRRVDTIEDGLRLLYPQRLTEPRHHHYRVVHPDKARKSCVYCSLKYKEKKQSQGMLTKDTKRTKCICNICQVALCEEHFQIFHDA